MPEKQVLKNLMLNLIYPAVLGTVMYGTLAATLEPLVGVLAGRTVTASADPNALLKAGLLEVLSDGVLETGDGRVEVLESSPELPFCAEVGLERRQGVGGHRGGLR